MLEDGGIETAKREIMDKRKEQEADDVGKSETKTKLWKPGNSP